jgi:type I restriction enzyme S subunit
VNYSRSTQIVKALYANAQFPLVPLRKLILRVQYGISELATSEQRGLPILRMNNLQNEGWDLSDLKYIELPTKEANTYLLERGDILFNRTNSKELVGKCEVFDEPGAWVFASYLIRVSVDAEKVLPDFVSLFLNTPAGRAQIDRISRQIVGMSNVNAEELQDLLLPLPLLDIQRNLVAEMQAARKARKQKIRQADELLASLDTYLLEILGLTPPPPDSRHIYAVRLRDVPARFDPHFHHPDFRKLTALIRTQPHASLGELAMFSAEQWIGREGETFRYIEISSVNTETGEIIPPELPVNEAPSRAQMVVHSGDLLISLTRPHHGAISLVDATLEGAIASTGFAVVRRIETERVRPDYLWCALHSRLGLQQMLQRSSGGNYPAITEAELSKVLIPVPSLQIQDQIAAAVRHRREQARRLRIEADADWQAAKRRFEQQLLGTEQQ